MDYSAIKYTQLQKLCKERHIKCWHKKKRELIELLIEYDRLLEKEKENNYDIIDDYGSDIHFSGFCFPYSLYFTDIRLFGVFGKI